MNKTKGVELMFFCDCGAAVFYSGAPITAKTVSCPLCRKNFTVNLGITDPALPPKPEPVTPSRELDWVEQLHQYRRQHQHLGGWHRLCLKVLTWAAKP